MADPLKYITKNKGAKLGSGNPLDYVSKSKGKTPENYENAYRAPVEVPKINVAPQSKSRVTVSQRPAGEPVLPDKDPVQVPVHDLTTVQGKAKYLAQQVLKQEPARLDSFKAWSAGKSKIAVEALFDKDSAINKVWQSMKGGVDVLKDKNIPASEKAKAAGGGLVDFVKGLGNAVKDFGTITVPKSLVVGTKLIAEGINDEGEVRKPGEMPDMRSPETRALVNKGAKFVSEWADGVINEYENQQRESLLAQGIDPEDAINDPAKFGYGIGQGASSILFYLGATALSKNPVVASSLLGWTEGSDTYVKSLEKIKADNPDMNTNDAEKKAAQLAILDAGGIALLEKVGMDSLFRTYAGGKLRNAVIGSFTETAQESTQTVWSNLVEKYGYNGAKGVFDDVFETMFVTAPIGFFGGGAFSSTDIPANIAAKEKDPEKAEEKRALAEEMIPVLQEQAESLKTVLENPTELDMGKDAFKEDIAKAVELKGKEQVVKDLANPEETAFPYDDEDSARQAVDEALSELARVDTDILDDMKAAEEAVKNRTGKKTETAQAEPATDEKTVEDILGELSDSEEAQNDWQDNYADEYGDLSTKLGELEKRFKQAKGEEKATIEAEARKIGDKLAQMENAFLDKYRKIAEEQSKARVSKAVKDVEKAVESEPDYFSDEYANGGSELIVEKGDYVVDASGELREVTSGNREYMGDVLEFSNIGYYRSRKIGEKEDYIGYANQSRMATAEELKAVGIDPAKAKKEERYVRETEEATKTVGDVIKDYLMGHANASKKGFEYWIDSGNDIGSNDKDDLLSEYTKRYGEDEEQEGIDKNSKEKDNKANDSSKATPDSDSRKPVRQSGDTERDSNGGKRPGKRGDSNTVDSEDVARGGRDERGDESGERPTARVETIAQLEDEMQKTFLSAGDSDVEGYSKADQAISEIMTSLELAEPGQLIFIDGEVRGVSSSFPSWIPDNSRHRDDLNYMIKTFEDVRALRFPKKRNETKRREFANAIFEQMDERLGVDTEEIRNQILEKYEQQTQGTKEESTGDNGGEQAVPRDAEERATETTGLDHNEIETVIDSSTSVGKDGLVTVTQPVTDEMRRTVSAYVPAGGRASQGREGRGLLDEYYTPREVVDMVSTALSNLGAFETDGRKLDIFEPSVGTGNFIYAIPPGHNVEAREVNNITARIAAINHEDVKVYNLPLEEMFIDDRGKKKPFEAKYDVVVGNPPYGEHRGKYKGLGEESKIARYETYFMKRSLDLTREGGYVAMVVPSSFVRSGTKEPGKALIGQLGRLVDAYRLPNGTFDTTGIGTDILIFERKTAVDGIALASNVRTMSDDMYFRDVMNRDHVLGKEAFVKGRYGEEPGVKGTLEEAKQLFEKFVTPMPKFAWHGTGSLEIEEGKLRPSKDGSMGKGVYLHTDMDSAVVAGAMQADGNIADQRALRVAINTRKIYNWNDYNYPEEDEIERIKTLGYEGIHIKSGEIIIFDSNNVELTGDEKSMPAPAIEHSEVVKMPSEELAKLAESQMSVGGIDVLNFVIPEQERRLREASQVDTDEQKAKLENAGLEIGAEVQQFVPSPEGVAVETGKIVKEDGSSVAYVKNENGEQTPWNENWISKKGETKTPVTQGELDLSTFTPQEELERDQWSHTNAKGELEGDFDKSRAFFMKGKWYNEFNYVQGNIYAKLDQLELDKSEMEKDQYERQKSALTAVLPERMPVERMKIAPNARFAETLMIGTETLQKSFLKWIKELPRKAFGESSFYDVENYTLSEPVRGGDKLQNEKDRRTRRIEGDRLFAQYLKDELTKEQKMVVEDAFNRSFNGYHRPDYSKVPLTVKVSGTYKNAPFNLRGVQRQGIGFVLNNGSGLIAHDVGIGKTIQGIIANFEMLARGNAKRPLIVVPNTNVYKQWVKDIKALKPEIKINELSNLGGDFDGDINTLVIPDGSISIVTEEGFKKLGFTNETYDDLTRDFMDVIENPNDNVSKRQKEKNKAKAEEDVAKGIKGTMAERSFEDLGFDAITVDEIHNANHIISRAKVGDEKGSKSGRVSEFRGFSQQPSEYGLKLWLASQYIQKKTGGRNVIGLSATPFTNHPLEYYSILSLFARYTMQEMGIFNVNDFMTMFMDVSTSLEFKADGSYTDKSEVRGMKNYQQWQQLLTRYVDFRGAEGEPDIKRPERQTREYIVGENKLSADYRAQAQELFQLKDAAGMLQGIGELRRIAFSPYISQYHKGKVDAKTFVEGSPKLKLTADLVKRTLQDVPDSKQLIYSSVGVEYFPLIKEYITTHAGLKAGEVEIITGQTPKNKRSDIQEAFNNGKVKVVIGSDAIQEGVNLQVQTTDLYMLSQPWNFTAVRQVIGRAWRQGNKWRNVRINQIFTENSIDIFLSQKLQNKEKRYEESLKHKADTLDVGDIDYEEMKHALLTDPVARVAFDFDQRKKELELAISREESDFAYNNRKNKQLVKLLDDKANAEKYYKDYPQYEWAKKSVDAANKALNDKIEELSKQGVDVSALQSDMKASEGKIAEIKKKIDALPAEKEKALKDAKIEKDAMLDTTRDTDYKAFVNEREQDNLDLYVKPGKGALFSRINKTFRSELEFVDTVFRATKGNLYENVPQELKKEISISLFGTKISTRQTTSPAVVEEWKEHIKSGNRPIIKIDDMVKETTVGDGHHRLEAYRQLGFTTVPVVYKTDLGKLWESHTKQMYARKVIPIRDATTGQFLGSFGMEVDPDFVPSTQTYTRYDMKRGEFVAKYIKTEINPEAGRKILERYQKRFKIDFPIELVEEIFTGERYQSFGRSTSDIVETLGKAYGVTYGNKGYNTIALAARTTRTTADHEFLHLVLANLDKIQHFKGFTKKELMVAQNGGKNIAGMTKDELIDLEEEMARGYEEYLAGRAFDTKQETLIDKFFRLLTELAADIYRAFGGRRGIDPVLEFYERLSRGRSFGETKVLIADPIYNASVKFKTSEGIQYLNFGEELAIQRREGRMERNKFFNAIRDTELMTNKVFRNKENELNFIMKDLNTLEDITAQAHDVYLKDPEQFVQAKQIESVGDKHDADKELLDQRFAEMIKPYMQLKGTDKERVEQALWRGDEYGKEWNVAELVRMSLSEEAIKAYQDLRDAFLTAHEMLLLEMIRKGVPQAEIDTFREERDGYMPHKWKYPFVVKHQRRVENKSGFETWHMESFKTEKEAVEHQKMLMARESDPTIRYAVDKLQSLEVDFFSAIELTPEKIQIVIEQMREEGFVKDHVVDILRKNLMDMFKEKGFGRHFLRRIGIQGFDTDNTPEIVANYFSGFTGYLTKMRWSGEYFQVLSQVDARRQPKYFAWLRDLVAYKLNNKSEWRLIRTIAFAWYLANDISYLAVNALQNWTVGMGELSKYVEGGQKAWRPEAELIKATNDWMLKRLTPDERGTIEGLLEKGFLGAEMSSELMGFKNNPLYNEISSRFSKVMYGSTAIVERNVNRIPAFLAARRIFLSQGMSAQKANDKALEVSNDIHFRYGRHHRPRIMRGRVNVLFVFQHYLRSLLYQLYRDAKNREFVSLTRKMMYTAVLGGTLALPFAKLLLMIFSKIADDEEDEELKKEIGFWEILITRGVPAALIDVDLSSRIGIEMLSVNKIVDTPTDVRAYIGVVGDLLFKRPFEVMDLISQERYIDATGKATPDVFANPIKAFTGYVWGVRSVNGIPLEDFNGDEYKYNTWEAIIKATGFTPTMESILWDAKAKEWDANTRKQDERTEIRRTILGQVQRGEIDQARITQDEALREGIISETTDYVREFAGEKFMNEAISAFESSGKTRADLKRIEEELIEKTYAGAATDDQRNNVRKEFAVYRQFGTGNQDASDIMNARTNKEKVDLLLAIKDELGEEAFEEFFKKGRTQMTTEAGNRVPILISDELRELYLKAIKNAQVPTQN